MDTEREEGGISLFGPTIKEIVAQCKIGYDTHFNSINVVYFDEHGEPRSSSPDRTPDMLHAVEKWFNFFSQKNKTPTLKIEKANGTGFVMALVPILQHKVQTSSGWFVLYMEKDGWKQSDGLYWKNGYKFEVIDEKMVVTRNSGLPNENKITLSPPKDELQVKVMLELIK